jgi:hypothetical protein
MDIAISTDAHELWLGVLDGWLRAASIVAYITGSSLDW